MLEEQLRIFGLTEYETKIYLALLEMGESTSSQILDKAKINTGKIYNILESLRQKGFVSMLIKNGVKKYFPADPESLKTFFEKKKKTLEDQEQEFNSILPNLLSKVNASKEDSHIEIYTGWNGLKRAFQKEIKRYKKDEELFISGVTNYANHPKKVVDYFNFNVFPERTRQKIRIKKIIDLDARENIKEKGSQIRLLPYSSIITINIISDLVIISIWGKEPIFITLEGREIAKGFRENFNSLWKIAKE